MPEMHHTAGRSVKGRLNMKPENLKARQGKATIDIIDARTEDRIGQFIIVYNK